ncbi:MAG: CHAT domain-containing protein [Pirellulaceae bacterium]|nr:CHAT domain-containing protein [Pirellulaceae bacterium]
MKMVFANESELNVTRESAAPAAARRGRANRAATARPVSPLDPRFLLPGVTVEEEASIAPTAARRGAALPPVQVTVDCSPGELAVIAVRHESGALTFHPPAAAVPRTARRGRVAGGQTVHFTIPIRPSGAARRGVVGSAIKFILLKVGEAAVVAAVGTAIEIISPAVEAWWWKRRGLKEEWFQVTPANSRLNLRSARPTAKPGERSLLLLHGTFSHAEIAFEGLRKRGFFDQTKPLYGDRVFAFNHFSVTRTLEENARMLLAGLPAGGLQFDVVTHSRGGLVLRTLVEQRAALGPIASRFQLGRAVLVAAPNQGTPLANPDRVEGTINLVANLIEMFPVDNPWTTGAEFVAHGIAWLAKALLANLPGLAAMDPAGPVIEQLQQPSDVPPEAYAALAANYHPDQNVWPRLLDLGFDAYFAGANDLVVPAEGSWLVDAPSALAAAPERIGCFGAGGNIADSTGGRVQHLNIMGQSATTEFLIRMLTGQPNALPPLDPHKPLPTRRLLRGGGSAISAEGIAASLPAAPAPAAPVAATAIVPPFSPSPSPPQLAMAGSALDDTLQLIILDSAEHEKKQILAIYGSARVLDEFITRDDDEGDSGQDQNGKRFQQIIRLHKRIRNCLSGTPAAKTGRVPELPVDDEMLAFGENLFETLFTGRVRRLYDVARSQQRERPLNLILTSTVPWLAALPWEFAFDPSRRKFLVTEEVHFVRNVLTAVPAQETDKLRQKLRMLVVAAQPLGLVELSLATEEQRIRHGFAPLTEAGLVELDVLTDATPARLHAKIQARELENRPHDPRQYDVVHFMGHGEFDRQANEGVLLFQTSGGGRHEVNVRTLREILCGRGIQLVFLNACDTAHDAHDRLNRGIAQGLVEGGIPAVVANQYPVLDDSAVGFTDHFYWSLGMGASLGEAAREARIALNYSISHESIDWAIPVLFARDPCYRLCVPRATVFASPPGAEPDVAKSLGQPPTLTTLVTGPTSGGATAAGTATVGTTSGPRAPALPKVWRVGVADLPRFFQELDDTLARLNDVQDRFVFETVEIVAPLGAWGMQNDRSYLHAEQFARLIQDKPRELGVDFLACITNRRMRDDDFLNLYGWWSDDPALRILIFSTHGLPLDALGPSAGRAVANQLVQSLAAHLLESQTKRSVMHATGQESCPFYYNEEVNIDSIVGRNRFEPRCRKKLLAKLPAEIDPPATLAAFDALLAAFDEPDT